MQDGSLWQLPFCCQSFWGRRERVAQPGKWHSISLLTLTNHLGYFRAMSTSKCKRLLWVLVAQLCFLGCCISTWYSLANHGSLLPEDGVTLLGHKASQTAVAWGLLTSSPGDLGRSWFLHLPELWLVWYWDHMNQQGHHASVSYLWLP